MITARFHASQEYQRPIPARKGFHYDRLSIVSRSLRQLGYGGQAASASPSRKERIRVAQVRRASQRHHINGYDANGRAGFSVDQSLSNPWPLNEIGMRLGACCAAGSEPTLTTVGKLCDDSVSVRHSLNAGDKGFNVHVRGSLVDEPHIGQCVLVSQEGISA